MPIVTSGFSNVNHYYKRNAGNRTMMPCLMTRIHGRLNRALLKDLDDIVEVVGPEPQVFAHRHLRRGLGDLRHLE
jgi:hypothetical protein